MLVTNATYSKEFKQDIPIVAPNLKPLLKFAMDVEYGSNVKVKNSNADVGVVGRMIISGNDLLPDVGGKVNVVSGSLFANETEFKIIQGIVVFPEGRRCPK